MLFVNKKLNKNDPGGSVRTKKSKIDNQNNIDFSNSKIEFTSININEDIIDIFLLHNSKKVISNTSSKNYYRIIAKDIGVKDSFQDIVCNIVNNIEVTISIKFKNKFSIGTMSMKDRLKFFNQSVQNQQKPNNTNYNKPIPKKIENSDLIKNQKNIKTKEEIKKEEINKKELPKKEEIKKQEILKKEIPIKEKKDLQNKKEQNIEKNMKENINNKILQKKEDQRRNSDKTKTALDKPNENKEIQKEQKKPNVPEKFEKVKVTLNKTKTLSLRDNNFLNDDFVVLDRNILRRFFHRFFSEAKSQCHRNRYFIHGSMPT